MFHATDVAQPYANAAGVVLTKIVNIVHAPMPWRKLMAKKILTVTIVAEVEIDTDWYNSEISDEGIKNIEGGSWLDWIGDHVKSEKIELRDA